MLGLNYIGRAVAALSFFVGSANAGAVTITFENYTAGAQTTYPLVYPDVTFTSSTGKLAVARDPGTLPKYLCTLTTSDCSGDLTLTFSNYANNLVFSTFDDQTTANMTFKIMTPAGTVTASGTSDGVNSTTETQDLSAYSNIQSLVIHTTDPYGIAFPSFSFDAGFQAANAVPETSTWLMMLSGAGLAGGILRRRKGMRLSVA